MKRIFIPGLLVGIVFMSCATYRFEAFPGDNIEIKYGRGKSYPFFMNNDIAMIVDPEFKDSEIMIKVTVKNRSNDVIGIADTDFSAYVSDDRLSWNKLSVYTSRDYFRKEKSEYTAGAVLMVLGAAASTYNAGQGYATTSGNVYGSGRYGSYSGSYTSTTRYYDPAAAQLANQRSAQMVSDYAQSGKQWLQVLEDNLFYSKELGAGEEYFGLVFSKNVSGRFYKIVCQNNTIDIVKIEYEKVVE